jgi:hypothetical protein
MKDGYKNFQSEHELFAHPKVSVLKPINSQ